MREHPIDGGQKNHNGIDIAMPKGAELASNVSGEVIAAGTYGKGSGYNNYGNVVAVKDAQGRIHVYAHLDNVNVKKGQKVNTGSFIGSAGSTGKSTGSHLHYEVRDGGYGKWLDPTPFLKG